jgi:hypothetical protein
MKKLTYILLTLALGGIAAGCGWDRSTAPQSQNAAWQLVRFHRAGDATSTGFLDLSVESNGELTLVSGRGEASSSRGLLAGERLETLARLVGALPPHSYTPASPCESDGFFISITRGGEVTTYASGSCDPGRPEALSQLSDEMLRLRDEISASRSRVVSYTVLARGVSSALRQPQTVLVRDRDALARLLREHSPERPVVLPKVDFKNQIVVAQFLGEQPTNGYEIDATGAEITESGMLRVQWLQVEPGAGCELSAAASSPFVLVAVEYHGEDLLFATGHQQGCPHSGGVDAR